MDRDTTSKPASLATVIFWLIVPVTLAASLIFFG
jgi:hypothetical protein